MNFYHVTFFCIFFLIQDLFAATPRLTEAQVFEWWDDGIVSAEEAQEMLNLLQEDNVREACILAEIYALESCESESDDFKSTKISRRKGRSSKKEPATKPKRLYNGRASWKIQTDSLGEVEKTNLAFQLSFYRFNLRLGTQELLTYKNKNAEAHFGQISTTEFHSHIPLDTLWGTALFYSISNFTVGAALDTAKNIQGTLNYSLGKSSAVSTIYWFSPQQQSIALQAKSSWGEISAWQLIVPNATFSPLIKLELHNKEQQDFQTLSWKTAAYIHGDSLPAQSHLSASLLRYKFWGSQSFSFSIPGHWNSKVSANTRIAIPLDADTASAKIKLGAESGPEFLRGAASVTCHEAENRCNKVQLKGKIASRPFGNEFVANFSVQEQIVHNKEVTLPRWEIAATYLPTTQNFAKISIVFPKGAPQERLQIRNEVNLTTQTYPQIRWNLASTFEKKSKERLRPVHGFLQINAVF